MKRKLLFAIVALLCSVGTWAYTTSDLTSSGWTLVTDFSSVSLADNYFLFVDGQEGKYSLAHAMPKGIGETDVRRPVYQAIVDPLSAHGQVWAIESYGEGTYAIQSIVDDYYLNSNGEWWSSHVSSGKSDDSKTKFISLGDGKYRLQKNGTSTYWGPYNDNPVVALGNASGMDFAQGASDANYAALAANKSEANAPGFYLYAISKATYNAQRHHSSVLSSTGWSEVTSTSQLGLAGYYYAFLDASEHGGESGFAMTGTNGRPKYKLEADPTADKTQLWTTEAHGSGYAIKNVNDGKYIYAVASWNMQATDNINTAHTDFIANRLSNGAWTLSNSISTSEFLGNYKNSPFNPTDGEDLAANKAAAKGKRTFLIYSIPTLAGVATALPANGDMAADTWYYIDIAAAADNYSATATTLSDIVYTTDGTTLFRDGITLSAHFTAENNSLSATRYYVKSTSANNLVIDVASYSYNVNGFTPSIADGSYVSALSSISFTFDANTNDPEASFALLNSSAKAALSQGGVSKATGNLTFEGNTLTASFDAVSLDLSSTYTIEIPAGVVGYEGHTTNTAVSLTLNTGVVAEGTYYIQNTADGQFFTHGANYGTEASLGDYAIPYKLALLSDGSYSFLNVDRTNLENTSRYLGANGYTDNATAGHWFFEKTGDNYYIKYPSGNYMHAYPYSDYVYFGDTGEAAAENGIVWKLLTKDEYNAILAERITAQVAAVATKARLSAANQSALETIIFDTDRYMPIDRTSAIANAALNSNLDGWTQVNVNGANGTDKTTAGACAEVYDGCGGLKQTISGLAAGLYKVTVNACWRPSNSGNTNRVGEDFEMTRVLFANTNSVNNQVQLKKWSVANDGNEPNSRAKFVEMADNYLNTIYVYVAENEDLTIGVMGRGNHPQSWMPFFHFTLTYYTDQVAAEDVAALLATVPTAKMSKENKEAIAEAKAALEAEGGATIHNYNALDAAIKAAAPSIAQYETYNYYISAFNDNVAGSATASGVQAKYDEGTVESLDAFVAAYRTYVLSTLATDKVTDYTAIIINPSFETGPYLVNTVTGWDVNSAAGEAFSSLNTTSNRAFSPGNVGSYLFNTWSGSNFWLRQNFGVLPAGQYRLTGYLASDDGTFTVSVGGASADVTCTGPKVGTPVSVVFTSDGTAASTFDITTTHWFKADNFHLTLIGDGSTPDLAVLTTAISTATAKFGFEDGEYAPYENVENIATVNEIQANAQVGTIGSYEFAAYVAQVEAIDWAANAAEVNAFGDPDFSKSGNGAAMLGWKTSSSAGLGGAQHARAFVLTSDMTGDDLKNYGYLSTFEQGEGVRSAAYMRFDGTNSGKDAVYTYGETEGYTMPLKAATYRLKAQFGGWGQVDKDITFVVAKADGTEVASQTLHTPSTGIHAGGSAIDLNMLFTLSEAANVKLQIKNTNTDEDNAIAISNLELKKAVATPVDIAETETEAPAASDYANVTLTRTIYSGFNTLVLPFDVDAETVAKQFGEGSKLYKFKGDEDGTLNFDEATAIKAHTPYLLHSAAGTDASADYTFDGVAITTGTPVAEGTDYNFVGTYTAYEKDADANPIVIGKDYVLGESAFHKTTVKNALKAFRAYIKANESAEESGAKMLTISLNGEETGIRAIDGNQLTNDGSIYNLAGQRVGKAQRGLYIINGKKVVVK